MEAKYDYLILGGGIAGVTAAETIREHDKEATIGVVSDEPHMPYSRVLIPSYLKKRIPREKLFLRRTEDFIEKKIDLRLEEEVAKVRPEEHSAELVNHNFIFYKKLLIASGGKVKPWGNPQDQDKVFHLQTLDDADRLFSRLPEIREPLVIGSSFIGLEFLEIFTVWGVKPTILVRSPRFFGKIFDAVGGEIIKENFAAHGITFLNEDAVLRIRHHEGYIETETTRGAKIRCDSFAVGVGLNPTVQFLAESGIATREGVVTDEFLATGAKDVWAAGDVAEYYDILSATHRRAGNWTNAFLQGKCAGLNMLGKREPYRNVSSYSISNLGLQITVVGDCADERNTIVRFGRTAGIDHYARIFIANGVIVGAALINQFQDKNHIAKLIENKTNVEKHRNDLKHMTFDIHNIMPV